MSPRVTWLAITRATGELRMLDQDEPLSSGGGGSGASSGVP
jgi:hypothetical protein